MDGLLGSRATWLAALGAGLSAIQQAIAVVASIDAVRANGELHPELFVVSALNTLATGVWCGYFTALYGAQRNLLTLATFRRITLFTLIAAFGTRIFLLGVQITSSMFLDLSGVVTVTIPALSIALWACVLLMLAFDRFRAHAEPIVTALLAITILQSLSTISPLLRGQSPARSSINFVYAATLILFLIALRNDPKTMIPAEA